MSATLTFADEIASARYEQLPAEVVAHVKFCLVDAIACGLGGRRTAEADAHVAMALAMGAEGKHVVFGEARRLGLLQAAQANRVLINALDYDDTAIMTGHMSSVAVPVALALGEARAIDGRALLTALALAYEAVLRLRRAVAPSPAAFRTTFERVDCGVAFCATVVAGRLLQLDGTGFADALGLTGHIKPWHVTMPSMESHGMAAWFKVTQGDIVVPGLQGALLAAEGFPGDRGIFDAGRGYGELVGSDRYDASVLTTPFGEPFQLLDIGFKRQTCCRHSSAFVDALELLLARRPFAPDAVDKIVVRARGWTVANLANAAPAHMIGAQFSLPHALAMTLLRRPPGPGWFADDALSGAEAKALRARVVLVQDDDAEMLYERERRYAGDVELITREGESLREFVPAPKGSRENPFSPDDHFAKLAAMVEGAGLPADRADRIFSMVMMLEGASGISALTKLLVP